MFSYLRLMIYFIKGMLDLTQSVVCLILFSHPGSHVEDDLHYTLSNTHDTWIQIK